MLSRFRHVCPLLPDSVLAAVVARGEAQCSELVCVKASRHIDPDEEWHLAHTADGSDYLGPAHAECNTSEGAARGNRMRGITPSQSQVSLTDDARLTPPSCFSLSPEERLAWDPDYLRGFAWLADLADVPEDASPPLMMSPVPDDAGGGSLHQRNCPHPGANHRAGAFLCGSVSAVYEAARLPGRAGPGVGPKGSEPLPHPEPGPDATAAAGAACQRR